MICQLCDLTGSKAETGEISKSGLEWKASSLCSAWIFPDFPRPAWRQAAQRAPKTFGPYQFFTFSCNQWQGPLLLDDPTTDPCLLHSHFFAQLLLWIFMLWCIIQALRSVAHTLLFKEAIPRTHLEKEALWHPVAIRFASILWKWSWAPLGYGSPLRSLQASNNLPPLLDASLPNLPSASFWPCQCAHSAWQVNSGSNKNGTETKKW